MQPLLHAGKRIAETLTMDYYREHGMEVRIVRIFNTYGPRMALDDGRVVSNFVAQVCGDQHPCARAMPICPVSSTFDKSPGDLGHSGFRRNVLNLHARLHLTAHTFTCWRGPRETIKEGRKEGRVQGPEVLYSPAHNYDLNVLQLEDVGRKAL
eukprot:825867-Pelagomonas_calceolata.AAC.14